MKGVDISFDSVIFTISTIVFTIPSPPCRWIFIKLRYIAVLCIIITVRMTTHRPTMVLSSYKSTSGYTSGTVCNFFRPPVGAVKGKFSERRLNLLQLHALLVLKLLERRFQRPNPAIYVNKVVAFSLVRCH